MNISELILMPKSLIILSFLVFLGYILYTQRKTIRDFWCEHPLKVFALSFGLVFGSIGAVYVYYSFGGVTGTGSAGTFGDFLNGCLTHLFSIATVLLVYLTFKSQKEAFATERKHQEETIKIQREEFEVQISNQNNVLMIEKDRNAKLEYERFVENIMRDLDGHYNSLLLSINNFQFDTVGGNYFGKRGIGVLAKQLSKDAISNENIILIFVELSCVTDRFLDYLDSILRMRNSFDLKELDVSRNISVFKRAKYLYYTYFSDLFQKLMDIQKNGSKLNEHVENTRNNLINIESIIKKIEAIPSGSLHIAI